MTAWAKKLAAGLACSLALAASGCGNPKNTEEVNLRRDAAIDLGHKPGLFEKDVHISGGQ